jgi:hypothetical protein
MALADVSWGAWEYNAGNGMRVGIEVAWSTPTYGSSSVTATIGIWTDNQYVYDDNQTLTYGGSISGTTNYLNNQSSTAVKRATKTFTHNYATGSYYTSPGNVTFSATVSGAFNSVTPSQSFNTSIPARPATNPGTPGVSSTPSDGKVTIDYSAPASDGGAPITGYDYSYDNSFWISTPSDPFDVSGANGTAITIYIRARNAQGLYSVTSGSATSTPRTTPGAPGVSSTASNGAISVSYSAPASNGGNAISSYQYSTDGGTFYTTPSNPFSVSGSNGTAITVYVRAVNDAGAGPTGSTTNTPSTSPGAPTSFAGNNSTFGQISLSWSAPVSNGGASITSYVLRNGTTVLQNQNLTSYTHTGLSPYTDYSYTVTAVNSSGEGSAASLTIKTMGGVAKVWDGEDWVTVLPKVWDGEDWVIAQARMWNGTEWKHGI